MAVERMAIAVMLVVSLVAAPLGGCKAQGDANEGSTGTSADANRSQAEQVANPWVDCPSLDEAESVAGFQASMPAALDGYGDASFQAVSGETIQATYGDTAAASAPVACVRKSLGEGQDVSGDYNDYPDSGTVDVEGAEVSLRGSGGSWSAATWDRDGFSYAITLTGGQDESWFSSVVDSVA